VEGVVSHSLVKALRSVPDFSSLPDGDLLMIVGASVNLFWPAGAMVFQKGSEAEALYIILSGRVRIFEVVDGSELEVSLIGPGESFGELSLMLHTTHTKDARAEEDTELMIVPEDSFLDLMTQHAELAAKFRQRLAERLPVRGDADEAQ
jgi:CRP-like cAMP-binding protein